VQAWTKRVLLSWESTYFNYNMNKKYHLYLVISHILLCSFKIHHLCKAKRNNVCAGFTLISITISCETTVYVRLKKIKLAHWDENSRFLLFQKYLKLFKLKKIFTENIFLSYLLCIAISASKFVYCTYVVITKDNTSNFTNSQIQKKWRHENFSSEAEKTSNYWKYWKYVVQYFHKDEEERNLL
jgi:hypothetical protein